jgi:L-amino acid N-acyltransferase YncA
MAFTIRPASAADARGMMEAHDAAIREKAAAHYDQHVIDAWAPPVTAERLARLGAAIAGPDWRTLVAEHAGGILGYGQVSAAKNRLGAVYVRRSGFAGVGRALMAQLLDHAREEGARFLEMDSSVNAEGFYRACGFRPLERKTRPIGASGREMACLRMRIDF